MVFGFAENTNLDCELTPKGVANKNIKYFSLAPKLQDFSKKVKKYANRNAFKKAIANFKWIDLILGSAEKTVLGCELTPRREARRSLVLTRDMKAGEVIKKEDLMPKRPGTGISPQFAEIVIGRKIIRDLDEDTILTWDMV